MDRIKLQSQYFGCLPYWAAVLQSQSVSLNKEDRFEKQSFRNRTYILGPNGLQVLVVPVVGRNKRNLMTEMEISYAEPWVRVHLNSLQTAYRSAPYFEYLFPEIESILLSKPDKLFALNEQVFQLISKRLKIVTKVSSDEVSTLDLSHAFHPKRQTIELLPYPQVFQEKFGFTPHAGILDLLMNHLSEASTYLQQMRRSLEV